MKELALTGRALAPARRRSVPRVPRLVCAVLAVALVAAGCAPAPSRDWPQEPAQEAQPGRHHMVAAANPLAAEAGRDILRRGGSAVDAAIAMQMVLNLVEPQSSGIGGGGFLLHYDAESGEVAAYDGRETAPAGATAGMFLRPNGTPKGFFEAAVGGGGVGVPGLLRMLETAHARHGRLAWADLFTPAIRLAEDGFGVSPRLHELIARDRHLKTFPATAAYFYRADGRPRDAGEILVNRPLARTLGAIAKGGADVFYRGAIARDIVSAVRRATANPGVMSEQDLAGYGAKARRAICRPYRVWRVCGMPPPSSGGVATLQALGILEAFELSALKPGSAAAVHLVSEASRLAFADRNRYLGDPDFVAVPVAALLDPAYLSRRAALISPRQTMGRALPGAVAGGDVPPPAQAPAHDPASTTHISVIDGAGNAVAFTSSIENVFGSRVMVRGFLLNNQLTDFSFRPEVDGRPVANRPAPGKRPLSSMSPTLVFDGQHRLVMTLGSPGGQRIIGYVLKTLVATLDWGLELQQAIDLPNHVNRNGPTEIEAETPLAGVERALKAMGHEVEVRELGSGLHGVMVTGSGLAGGADSRREGAALGD